MATIIDELIVRLGLDPKGFNKGRAEQKAALDQMREETQRTQTAIDAIQAKAVRQKRQHAAEERAILQQIAQLNRTTVDATSATHNRQVKELRTKLAETRAANKAQADATNDELTQQKKVLAAQQSATKEEDRKQRDQADQSRKRIQRAREEGSAVQALTTKVIGLFAAFTAGEGLASFLKNTFTGAAAAGRLADNLGVDIEALGAWEGAVTRVGGAAADADGALASLVKTRELIRAGQLPGDQAKVLNSFGITAQDLEDPIATLEKLAAARGTMSKAQFSLRLGMLGFDQNAINALEGGREGLRGLMDEARRAGVVTKAQAEEAQRVTRRWEDMKAASVTLGRTILKSLAPAIEWITGRLRDLAAWGQRHPRAMATAIGMITAALAALAAVSLAPLIAGLAVTVVEFWPLIAAALALGAAITWLTQDFAQFEKTGKSAVDWGAILPIWERLKKAMAGVAEAGQAVIDAIPPEVWDFITFSVGQLGETITNVLIVAMDILSGILRQVSIGLYVVRDVIKLIVDLLRGDWKAAWNDAGQTILDFLDLVTNPLKTLGQVISDVWDRVTRKRTGAAPSGPGVGFGLGGGTSGVPGTPSAAITPASGGAVGQASALLRRFENFRSKAYWDVNAYRVGYGSDTITDPATGRVTRVTASTSGVTREMAEADLQRRIRTEFLPAARNAIGAAKWDALPDATKAAILSTTYNYGTTPGSVVRAARTGDTGQVARAIEALKVHNGGINATRRATEAAYIRGGGSAATPTPTASRAPTAVAPGKPAPFYVDAEGHWRRRDEAPSAAASPIPTPTAVAPRSSVAARAPTPVPAPLADAATTLLNAAQTLLAAANAMRATYDRGLNVGAGAGMSHQFIANDNSTRSESTAHIGQVNIHGSNARQIWGSLEQTLSTRGLGFNAASGLSQ